MSRGKTANGTAIKRIEMRRCIACRQVRHKSELLRVVKNSAGEILFDATGKISGHGAYICKSAECMLILKKRRSLDRVFKLKLPNDLYDKICAAT